MKKTLLLLGFVLTAIVANAQSFKDAVSGNAPLLKTTSANNTAAPAERVLKAPSKALMHKLSVPKDEKPIFDPEGEDEAYIMAYTENNGFYEQQYTNGKVTVRQDGTTYYLNGLTPGGNRDYRGAKESWLKGEKEGEEIVVKAGQVLVQNDAKTLYLEIVHADEEGNITSFEKEARLAIGSQGELTTQNGDIFAIYEDAETEDEAGFFGFFYTMELRPLGELVRFEFPKGVKPQTYVLSGTDANGVKASRQVKIAFSDGKFFISGLASKSPEEVYEGTYSGTTASIPSFQIVKDADLFFYRIAPVSVDEDMNYEFLRTIDFNFSDDRKLLTMTPEKAFLCETTYDLKDFVTTATGVTMTYYAGDHAAKPATPTDLQWDDLNSALVFNMPTEDVNGEYINADKLSYRIYADGKRYTFTTDLYTHLTKDMDEIPFGFTDNFDFVNNGTQKVVYFHNLQAKKLHVESVYTVDGTATASDRALYDFDPTGISSNTAAKQPVSTVYYSMEGAQIATPAKGAIVLKSVTYADGERRVTKEIVK